MESKRKVPYAFSIQNSEIHGLKRRTQRDSEKGVGGGDGGLELKRVLPGSYSKEEI